MKIKYRHFSEPDRVKIIDTEIGYRNPSPFGPPCRDMTLEEYNKFQLEKMAKDIEKGRILEFEVIDDLTAEKLKKQAIFDLYKNRLMQDGRGLTLIGFNAIEYVCQIAEIDPIEMAVALRKEGRVVVFDDPSISHGENVRKRKAVEKRFAEVSRENDKEDLKMEHVDKKYVLRAYYMAVGNKRTLADFVVTNPVVTDDGIWATSRNAWGGESRNFYKSCDIVGLKEDVPLYDVGRKQGSLDGLIQNAEEQKKEQGATTNVVARELEER